MKRILLILLLSAPAIAFAQIKIDNVDILPSSCAANGKITINVSGNDGDVCYYYKIAGKSISKGQQVNDPVFSGLPGGKYIVEAYDLNGFVTKEITLPSTYENFKIDIVKSGSLVNGIATGNLTVIVTGGCKFIDTVSDGYYKYRYKEFGSNTPYSDWQTDNVFTDLAIAKTYEIQVEDACGSLLTQEITIYSRILDKTKVIANK